MFLGVHRALDRDPKTWLVFPEFSKYAAALLTPSTAKYFVTQVGEHGQNPVGESMVTKLAQEWNRKGVPVCPANHSEAPAETNNNWLARAFWRLETSDKLASFSLIDYSAVHGFRESAIRVNADSFESTLNGYRETN